jgi:hypothetical protein
LLWVGDPLFRASVYDSRRGLLVDHRLGEDLQAVDHAPEVDPENPQPAVVAIERAATTADAGVVHQNSDLAEAGIGGGLQRQHRLQVTDIGRDRKHVGGAAGGEGGHLGLGRGQGLGVGVGQDHLHAEAGEAPCGRQADAAGRAGDHGRATLGYGGMIH